MPSITGRRCSSSCEHFGGVDALAFVRGSEIDCGGCRFESGRVWPAYVGMVCRFGLPSKQVGPVTAAGRTAEALSRAGGNRASRS